MKGQILPIYDRFFSCLSSPYFLFGIKNEKTKWPLWDSAFWILPLPQHKTSSSCLPVCLWGKWWILTLTTASREGIQFVFSYMYDLYEFYPWMFSKCPRFYLTIGMVEESWKQTGDCFGRGRSRSVREVQIQAHSPGLLSSDTGICGDKGKEARGCVMIEWCWVCRTRE